MHSVQTNILVVALPRVILYQTKTYLIVLFIVLQCSKESCPTMSGGSKFEYLWQVLGKGRKFRMVYLLVFSQDGVKYKKPVHLPAPQYISLLMDWVETQINDEQVEIMLFTKA